MNSFILLSAPLLPALLYAQSTISDPGGVLSAHTVARFEGSGVESIQSMRSDSAGNLYVAGTTSSPDLLLTNATQPSIGEALLMQSLDRGVTWQKFSNPPAAPLAVTPHPRDPQAVLATTSDGVYKTSDGGRTWRRVYSWPSILFAYPNQVGLLEIVFDPSDPRYVYGYIFGVLTGVLVSVDAGESWQLLKAPDSPGHRARPIWVDPNGSGTVAFTGVQMWLSRDHGRTWVRTAPVPGYLAFSVPDPSRPGWIYAVTTGGTTGALYLSKDWGATWTERPSPTRSDGFKLGLARLEFDPDIPGALYALSLLGRFHVSRDDGTTWSEIPPGGLVYISVGQGPVLLPRRCGGGAMVAVASLGRVASSFDFGVSWEPPQISRAIQLAAGPACSLYAVRGMASDAFIAKLAPGGREVLWSTYLGGFDLDASAALALDSAGNVYVAGRTESADFPTTVPLAGTPGEQNVFVAKLDAQGKLIYSTVFGGQFRDIATALAVNASEEAFITGSTTSTTFPVTAGAYRTEAARGDGFVVKLNRQGTIAYATYLPNFISTVSSRPSPGTSPRVVVAAAEADGSVLLGGFRGTLYRLSPDGSALTSVGTQRGGISAIESDMAGNVYIAGQTTGGGSQSCFAGWNQPYLSPGDIYVTKLDREGLSPVYSALLSGHCHSRADVLRVGSTGEVTLGVVTFGDFPLTNPLFTEYRCGFWGNAVVAGLNPDGSASRFSTYLDMCAQSPAVAMAPDGSVFAGVTRSEASFHTSGRAGVLHLPVPTAGGIALSHAVNAFSGSTGWIAAGTLVRIEGENIGAAYSDLGLNYARPLPLELDGVRVLFDGTPAGMLQTAPDYVMCVIPLAVAREGPVSVQVFRGERSSLPFVLRLTTSGSANLLTRFFPALPAGGTVDGVIRNADGSLNDAGHPAAPGSTITLFATGLTEPGRVYLLWNAPPPRRLELIGAVQATARRMPGFIDALWAIDFRIPDAFAEGVYLVPRPGVLTRAVIGRVGSGIGVYVK